MDVVSLAAAVKKAKAYTDTSIAALPKGLTYKGSVATVSDLPTATSSNSGWMYTVLANGHEYVSDGTQWVDLSSDLANKEDISNKVTSLSGTVTDTQYPSAKLVSDTFDTFEEALSQLGIDMMEYVDSHHDSTKQNTLVSGTNIKTINNSSLLGSGNLNIGINYDNAFSISKALYGCIGGIPNIICQNDTLTCTITRLNSYFSLPNNITVTGCAYTWTLEGTTTGTLVLSNPTGNVSINIEAPVSAPGCYYKIKDDNTLSLIGWPDTGYTSYTNGTIDGNYTKVIAETNLEFPFFSPSAMFRNKGSLIEVDISKTFNISSFMSKSLESMFEGCYNLKTINLSGLDSSNITNMGSMFADCTNLEHIYVGDNWSTSNVTSSTDMFKDCINLHNYMYSFTDKEFAIIDDGINNGYLERKTS